MGLGQAQPRQGGAQDAATARPGGLGRGAAPTTMSIILGGHVPQDLCAG